MITRLLGIDGGFASIGVARIRLPEDFTSNKFEIDFFSLISTEKSDKKQNTFASNDNVRRAREICSAIDALVDDSVIAICAEAMSFPRSASVAAKMAMCWGVLSAISHFRKIPILQASPQAIKIALTSHKGASKDDMTAAVLERFPALAESIVAMARGDREHPVDALSAILACIESDVVKSARRALAKGRS